MADLLSGLTDEDITTIPARPEVRMSADDADGTDGSDSDSTDGSDSDGTDGADVDGTDA